MINNLGINMLKWKRIKGKIKTSLKAYKFGIVNFRKLIKFLKIAPDDSDLKNTPQMSVFEAHEQLKNGNLLILDVRSPKDFKNGYIEGSIHVDLFNVVEEISHLPRDKNIGVLCYGGGASLTVTQMFLDNGLKNVKNIKGGIIRFALDDDESLLEDL